MKIEHIAMFVNDLEAALLHLPLRASWSYFDRIQGKCRTEESEAVR